MNRCKSRINPRFAVTLWVSAMTCTMPALAQNSHTTESRMAQSQTRSTDDADLDELLARDWGLHAEEWTRYRHLMQGPTGIYSPNLDPLTALGIEARSDQERRHYAE